MIPVGDLGTYLHAIGVDAAVPVLSPDLIDLHGLSDRAIFAFPTTGPGPLLELPFTVPAFSLRFRGVQDQGTDGAGYADAEALAFDTDKRLLTAVLPATISGRHVTKLGRTGGDPTFLFRDNAGRTHFGCVYYFEIAVS